MKQFILPALLSLALAACGNSDQTTASNSPESQASANENIKSGGTFSSCKTRAYEEIGGPISLIDQNGTPRTEADFKGEPALVFFGFTYCPDVCPITLVKLNRALQRVSEDKRPVPILITVDPERDTPEALSKYLSLEAYPENTVGLTGSSEAVRAAADAFIADYSRVPLPDSEADYTMDHTSLVYLMDEDWKLKTFFNYTASDADIAACLEDLL